MGSVPPANMTVRYKTRRGQRGFKYLLFVVVVVIVLEDCFMADMCEKGSLFIFYILYEDCLI